jgi:hypothetical protein
VRDTLLQYGHTAYFRGDYVILWDRTPSGYLFETPLSIGAAVALSARLAAAIEAAKEGKTNG